VGRNKVLAVGRKESRSKKEGLRRIYKFRNF
jgi:hypothetical protein